MFKVLLLVTLATFCAGERHKLVCHSDGHYAPHPEVDAALKACGDVECVMKCQIKVLELADDQGKFTIENLLAYYEEVAPPEYLDLIKDKTRGCYEQYGPFAPEDDHCTISKHFADCVWSVLPQMTCDPNSQP